MKYVLLIYQPDAFNPKALSGDEREAIGKQYHALSTAPNVTPGPPLGSPRKAITVRVNHGAIKADEGPYVSSAGAVGGFMVLEAESQEEAIALAARIPAARLGGAVEVRPCEIYW